jgi:hypothetical protein
MRHNRFIRGHNLAFMHSHIDLRMQPVTNTALDTVTSSGRARVVTAAATRGVRAEASFVVTRLGLLLSLRRTASGVMNRGSPSCVLFWWLFRHNFAENGLQDLKMVYKDASHNSTQSVIKISSKLNTNIEKVTAVLVLRSWDAVLECTRPYPWVRSYPRGPAPGG